jgi:hypothetical protein
MSKSFPRNAGTYLNSGKVNFLNTNNPLFRSDKNNYHKLDITKEIANFLEKKDPGSTQLINMQNVNDYHKRILNNI